jgi:hypothetical protein
MQNNSTKFKLSPFSSFRDETMKPMRLFYVVSSKTVYNYGHVKCYVALDALR